MPIVVGTNSGFVTSAPGSDPGGVALQMDTRAHATKDTAPTGATTVTEIGWWCDNATEAADYEVAVYTDAGANEPELVVGSVSTGNAKGTTSGWKSVTGLSISITAGTAYWIAVQLDDTATTTNIDGTASGAAGRAQKNSVTALPADWGTSSATDTDAAMAIYAIYTTGGGGETLTRTLSDSTTFSENQRRDGLFTR